LLGADDIPPVVQHRPSLLPRPSIASFSSYDASRVHYSAPVQPMTTREILSSGTFLCLFLSLLLNGIWCQTTSGLFKVHSSDHPMPEAEKSILHPQAYGQTFIHDDFFLATVNSFGAAANCLSRIFWGAVADRVSATNSSSAFHHSFQSIVRHCLCQTSYQLAMSVACAAGAVLMWTLGLVELMDSPVLFFVWVPHLHLHSFFMLYNCGEFNFAHQICAMFCCVGATYALVPYATHICFGSENFGIAYGCIQLSLVKPINMPCQQKCAKCHSPCFSSFLAL
jgi:hypothetical protein